MLNMNDIKILIANNKYPCYIREKNSFKITYANKEFFKDFECDENIYGKKITDLIEIDQNSAQKIVDNALTEESWEFKFYHNSTSKNYSGISTLLSDGNTVFCEYKVYKDKELENKFEQAMARCMDIYQQPDDVLVSFMELLCEYYGCSRASVYGFNKETTTFNCVSGWSNDGHTAMGEITKKEYSKFLIKWIGDANKAGIVMVDEKTNQDAMLGKLLEFFQIENIILCAVLDVNNEVIGLVGLSNFQNFENFFDRRLINTIARFVANNVSKALINEAIFREEHRDTLTGLYNRIGYSRRLNKLQEKPPESLGVIFANINGLKYINENYGTHEGDDLVKFTAHQLKDYFKFEFFRMSGDEFVGLALDIEKTLFEAKVTTFHKTMRDNQNHDVSVGHAWGNGSYSLLKLLQEAENIMYINKQEYYHSSDRPNIANDNVLTELFEHLENRDFVIYLQPQVNLDDNSLYGAEALIRRYDRANDKLIYPDQFIPLYEQRSIIRHIDLFVIESVCKILQQWGKEGYHIPISINLSRVTLQEFGIVDTIIEICDKYEVPHKYLVIEVTERVGLVENNVASNLIQQFKDNGFNISLDDFGSAYSNIVTLAQIEVDEVKLDKSLVDDLTTSKKNHTLVKNVLSMCNELDKTSTLAEGIEDAEQAKLLHELGCHLGQGYFYSRPIPVDEFKRTYIKKLS